MFIPKNPVKDGKISCVNVHFNDSKKIYSNV